MTLSHCHCEELGDEAIVRLKNSIASLTLAKARDGRESVSRRSENEPTNDRFKRSFQYHFVYDESERPTDLQTTENNHFLF